MGLRVGVIGGGIGMTQILHYKETDGVDFVTLADTNEKVNHEASARFGVNTYTDYEEMIEKVSLDAVSICTPLALHAPMARYAAGKGLHILLEKPMATSLRQCDEIIQACERNKVKLMIGFKKRFCPAYVKLKELIETRTGKPYAVDFRYTCYGIVNRDWYWKEDNGRGPLVENSAHAMDVLRYLCGDIQRVYAEGDNFLAKKRKGVDQLDTAVATARFHSGTVASLRLGCWSGGPLKVERMTLNFDGAMAEVYGTFDSPSSLKLAVEGDELEEYVFATQEKEDVSGMREEIKHFVRCILNDEPIRSTGSDGRKSLEACLAIKESIRKENPVELLNY